MLFDITPQVEALLLKAKSEPLIDAEPIIFPEHFISSVLALDSLTAVASAFTEKEDSYFILLKDSFFSIPFFTALKSGSKHAFAKEMASSASSFLGVYP